MRFFFHVLGLVLVISTPLKAQDGNPPKEIKINPAFMPKEIKVNPAFMPKEIKINPAFMPKEIKINPAFMPKEIEINPKFRDPVPEPRRLAPGVRLTRVMKKPCGSLFTRGVIS